MGKSLTLLQSRGILICSTCDKPIVGESIMIPNKLNSKVFKWAYHTSPTECANAPDLIKDWRRNGRAKAHNRTQARLQERDGYSWDTDDSMPMR